VLFRKKKTLHDLDGKKFGKWTVLAFDRVNGKKSFWKCRCDCGTERSICRGSLTNGGSLSCGCARLESLKKKFTTHGKTKTRAYRIWEGIKVRCGNKDDKYYAGRGIALCERWKDFENFYADMGDPPGNRYSIDRIDNSGHYEPGNCRWVTSKKQANNRRNSFLIYFDGKTKTASEWSELSGVKPATIKDRIRRGWNTEEAIFKNG